MLMDGINESLVNKPVIPLQLPTSHPQNVCGDCGVNPISNRGLILKSAGHHFVDVWIWLTRAVHQQKGLKVAVSASEQADIIRWPSAGLKSRSNSSCIKPPHSYSVVTINIWNSLQKVKVVIRHWDEIVPDIKASAALIWMYEGGCADLHWGPNGGIIISKHSIFS